MALSPIQAGDARETVKAKLAAAIDYYYSTGESSTIVNWGNARTKLNAIATALGVPTWTDREIGSSTRSKINAIFAAIDAATPAWAVGFDLWRDLTGVAKPAPLLLPTDVHSSPIMAQNAAGVWSSFAANVLVRTDLGLQTVPTRANGVPNSAGSGAIAGSPGTTPTGWAWGGNGLSRVSTALATIFGLPCTDIRSSGTATSSPGNYSLMPGGVAAYPVVAGQLITASLFFAELVAHADPATDVFRLRISFFDGAGAAVGSVVDKNLPRTTIIQRTENNTIVPVGAVFASLSVRVGYTVSSVYDYTVRIAAQQLELGAFASPPILTTGTAATVTGNVQSLAGLSTQLATGVGGFITSDVKGFDPAALPVLIGLNPSSQVAQALMVAAIESAANLATGLQTIAFAASEAYAKVRVVGQADIASAAATYQAGLDRLSYGGNGFDASNNIYAIHKRIALRFGAMNDTIFNDIYAKAAL